MYLIFLVLIIFLKAGSSRHVKRTCFVFFNDIVIFLSSLPILPGWKFRFGFLFPCLSCDNFVPSVTENLTYKLKVYRHCSVIRKVIVYTENILFFMSLRYTVFMDRITVLVELTISYLLHSVADRSKHHKIVFGSGSGTITDIQW